MSELLQYVLALSNLYGLVHKEHVKDIYNQQNKHTVELNEIDQLLFHPPIELEQNYVYPEGDYFVTEAVAVVVGPENLLLEQKGKPFFVPPKNKLLLYADYNYFERTQQYTNLLRYLTRHFFDDNKEQAEEVCTEIRDMCSTNYPLNMIIDALSPLGITFESIEQANKCLSLISELANHTRIQENNGHTPYEIFEKYEKPLLKPLPRTPFDNSHAKSSRTQKTPKIGRNDPCLCGSGKKYKKCCMDKDRISQATSSD